MSEDTRMIRVGDHRVGIVALQEIFEEMEEEYAAALLNEYKKFLGMAVKEEKGLEIKILGLGCARCDQLEREVMNVLAELGLPADLEHVRDITKLKEYKVFGTPALVINGKVKSVGKVPSRNEIRHWIGKVT